ncbi:nudix hydrolase 15, mitochondrial-like isoform X3 [Iris pallida]|uniref:Nudix hydrolase 15, mitochondrial-like isoform X3 n=1 Tax=Iris pallida TaxID=29817 RepID=A0AAX6IF36_IRIPA|nr:nudix hydrolase 15, mitochondrial-like isoform X3 [Iris pallida]
MGSSQRLASLVQRLRLYKPEEEEDDGGDTVGPAVPSSSAATPRPDGFSPRRAAVLVCLFEDDDSQLRVILTKRSSTLSTHSGEVSLPGGKAEAGDADDKETALREAKEEIGLDPSLVTVVAVLEPFLSKHLLRVAPVIAVLSDKKAFTPVVNIAEVETVFDAPLEMFLKDENRRSEEREWMGNKFTVHFFDFEAGNQKFLIWGLTASILIRAASAVYEQRPSFPEEKPKIKIPPSTTADCYLP